MIWIFVLFYAFRKNRISTADGLISLADSIYLDSKVAPPDKVTPPVKLASPDKHSDDAQSAKPQSNDGAACYRSNSFRQPKDYFVFFDQVRSGCSICLKSLPFEGKEGNEWLRMWLGVAQKPRCLLTTYRVVRKISHRSRKKQSMPDRHYLLVGVSLCCDWLNTVQKNL